MNLDAIYAVLSAEARRLGILTYTELSTRYQAATGDWHEPHGSWDNPLGELNVALHAAGWPPLSAVVVLKETGEPGGLFWGSSPGIPPRPSDPVARIGAYAEILQRVHRAPWPDRFPQAAPPND